MTYPKFAIDTSSNLEVVQNNLKEFLNMELNALPQLDLNNDNPTVLESSANTSSKHFEDI